jgi:hypothetical protein
VARLLSDLTLLDLLIVWRYSKNGSDFQDFHVRQEKVMRALEWLKANNKFYRNIKIDNETLQALPENGSIADKLPQFMNDKTYSSEEGPNNDDENENDENSFNSQTFVLSLPARLSE